MLSKLAFLYIFNLALLVAYAHYIICHELCAYYCKKILR
nr:MAG TPA: Protein of unknown function DUF45 [Caudoviricetes sp.]